MADYFTPTVVQQEIPVELMSPFEKLLLGHVFDCDQDGGNIYFHAWERPRDFVTVDRSALAHALSDTAQKSRLRAFAEKSLAQTAPGNSDIDLDLTETAWGSDVFCIILQDIVRRAQDKLPYLTIACAHTCSSMRAGGFGGHAIVITPRTIRTWSTHRYFEAFTKRFEKKQLTNQHEGTLP